MDQNIKEVDTVISTHEIIDLIKRLTGEENFDINKYKEKLLSNEYSLGYEIEDSLKKFLEEKIITEQEKNFKFEENFKFKMNSFEDGTSNSYLYHVIKYFTTKILKNEKVELQIKQGKNSDLIVNIFIINSIDIIRFK